jgi:S-adenosylmethionine:tRNA ribosyltransferase-isomerase
MRTDTFDFDLPPERIAQEPAFPRDSSRLLEVFPDHLRDGTVLDLPTLLQPGDLLVLNDTRVIPTRLFGKRGDTKIEVTLHKPLDRNQWYAFARPGRRLRVGDTIDFTDKFSAKLVEKRDGGEVLLEMTSATGTLMDALYNHGEMPLPPYIERADGNRPTDRENYQTVYARNAGAVAAPTAGLHFTDNLFGALNVHGIKRTFVTLHVGAGTFLPIKSESIENHRMHAEYGILSPETARLIMQTRAQGGRVVAVGSTSLRLIETAAQNNGKILPFEGETDVFIAPGYHFKAVDLFLTNFHLPKSTLFVLVSAFSGMERMKSAYAHAIDQAYQFYSYGDCCLLHPNKVT